MTTTKTATPAAEEALSATPLHRIQFVSQKFPHDFSRSNYGIFQRMRMLLEACVATGARVQVLFLVPQQIIGGLDRDAAKAAFAANWGLTLDVDLVPFDDARTPTWVDFYIRPIFSATLSEDYRDISSAHAAVASRLDPQADLVVAHRLHAALPVLRAAADTGSKVPVVIDIDDVEHRKFSRELRRPPHWPGKRLKFLQVPALAWAERRSVRAARSSLVCSAADRRTLSQLAGCDRVTVVPNSVDLGAADSDDALPALTAQPTVLFVGSYTHQPNVEAAEHLIRSVFPRVRSARPDAKLIVVGPRIDNLPSSRDVVPPGVELRGFVDDLAPVWREARVLACPIFAAGGTRIKIIEAAARGVPVVSTTVGAEGLDFVDGRSILLRDSPTSFAAALVEVLSDDALALRLSVAARREAAAYDRRCVIAQLVAHLRQCAGPTGAR